MDEDVSVFALIYEGIECKCIPVGRQAYDNCYFEAGLVEGHPYDSLYVKLKRDNEETVILFRPDEMLALIWVMSGALWSQKIADVSQREE